MHIIPLKLVHNSVLLCRFLILCMCSRFGGLSIQALDTLGNIGHEVILKPKEEMSKLVLECVGDGVYSPDRAKVLRSLEVLNRLAMSDANEEVMAQGVRQEVRWGGVGYF